MIIRLRKELVAAITIQKLKRFNINEDKLRWKDYAEVTLIGMPESEVKELLKICQQHKEIRGAVYAIRSIETWLASITNAGAAKVRRLDLLKDLLVQYLKDVPGHRIYRKSQMKEDAWLPFYVSRIIYIRPEGMRPPSVEIDLIYEQFGDRQKTDIRFYDSDIHGNTVAEILTKKGWFIETPDLRDKYLSDLGQYTDMVGKIGKQYLANGIATESGVPVENDDDRSSSHHDFLLADSPDVRNRVVVDVFTEKIVSSRSQHEEEQTGPDLWFWQKATHPTKEDEDDFDDSSGETPDGIPVPAIEIPVHPVLVVFDLQRHLRLAIHASCLTPYVYDREIMNRLILPDQHKLLVKMLVEHKTAGFKDIIAGKSGGAIILLTGPPGLGKTLTVEVFAESEEKALYSVHASQLGIDPAQIEKELMLVLQRAARWNAILLIDEADVYAHERGSDLQQNAIVGVLLRVLEYHSSVLFLTTNRGDLVDDAIASRCIAKIDYEYPSPADQKKIWRVLADGSGVKLSDSIIETFVKTHPKMSGRDVKNLLKLAQLISAATKEPIDVKALEYVLKFKPTVIVGEKSS